MNTNCFFCARKNATCSSCEARAARAASLRLELAAIAAESAESARATRYFFDSWGTLWRTCRPSDRGAEAFGPQWTACLATESEVWAVWESLYAEGGVPRFSGGERSLYAEAKKAGWTYEEDGWTYLR